MSVRRRAKRRALSINHVVGCAAMGNGVDAGAIAIAFAVGQRINSRSSVPCHQSRRREQSFRAAAVRQASRLIKRTTPARSDAGSSGTRTDSTRCTWSSQPSTSANSKQPDGETR